MKTTSIKFLIIMLGLLAFSTCSKDEEPLTGNIMGKVTDANTGDVLQGVTITLTPGGTSRTTGSDGTFEFLDLDPKQYEIQAKKKDYITNTKAVTVVTGRDIRGDIQLSPVIKEAKIALSVSSLNFGKDNESLSFEVINEGEISFNWNISGLEKVDWLEVKPSSGSLAPGKKNAVQVNLLREKLTEDKEISILVNADKESVALKITAEAEEKFSKLTLNTNTLNFGDSYSSLTFDIKNEGNIGDIEWSISDIDAEWIKVSPVTGVTAMGKSSTVKIDLDREKLPQGEQTTTILVNSEGESQRVTINAVGEEKFSKLTLNTNTLNFGDSYSSLTFDIKNEGNIGDIEWSISNIDAEWIKVSPVTGVTAMGKSSTVKIDLDREKQPHGEQTTTILVNSEGESQRVTINAVGEEKVAKISLSTNTLDFGTDQTSLTFNIKNEGNAGDISWEITGIDVNWLSVYPTTGATAMDKSSAVKVEINRDLMAEGNNSTTILVNAYGESFPVTINVTKKGARYLEVTPSALILGTNESVTFAIMSHNGPTMYELQGEGDYSWATFSKTSGFISEYDPTNGNTIERITISANRTGLSAGEYNFTLVVRSDLEDIRIPVSMTVEEEQIPGGENAEIISCHEDLKFTLTSCKISGTTVTIDMKVKNEGSDSKNVQIRGGYQNGYAYDDQGNKYYNNDLQLAFANDAPFAGQNSTEIPDGVMTKITIKILNVAADASQIKHIALTTNMGSDLILKNVAIEGRTSVNLPSPSTTGTIVTCNENLDFTLIDCKAGSTYTTIKFYVKNTSSSKIYLQIRGGYQNGFAYDDQGNKYNNNDLQLAFANDAPFAGQNSTYIPEDVTVKGTIRLYNVDANATEFSNITIKTNQESDLVLKNVKIRR